ncbi:MAG: thiamine pyrophosphate-dependent enzyme, partial [Methanomassiliicoccales archaeon]
FNYSVGGLGYAFPASIGAYFASGVTTTCITTDGSFAFNLGELETVKREGADIKIFIFNNSSFGWIRAAMVNDIGRIVKGTQHSQINFSGIAHAFGLPYHTVERTSELQEVLHTVYGTPGPCLINVECLTEDQLVPPVPEWRKVSRLTGSRYMG